MSNPVEGNFAYLVGYLMNAFESYAEDTRPFIALSDAELERLDAQVKRAKAEFKKVTGQE